MLCRRHPVHFKQEIIPIAKAMLVECIQQIHTWLSINKHGLNPDKTEVMWCLSAHRMGTFEQPLLCIGQSTIRPSCVVRELGVQLRADTSIKYQINAVVRSCNYDIRQLCSMHDTFVTDTICSAGCGVCTSAVTHRLLQCTVYKCSRMWTTTTTAADQHSSTSGVRSVKIWPYNWFHMWRSSLAADYSASTFQSLFTCF